MTGLPDAAAIRRELDAGNLVLAYDLSQTALEAGRGDADTRYLHVLVLARMGLTDRAIAAYDRLDIAGLGTVDAGALMARLLKDRALATEGAEQGPALVAAAERYRAVHDATGALFPAINAATLFALAGEDDRARSLASQIVDTPLPDDPDYYDLATLAEAQVILQRHDHATRALAHARGLRGAGLGARAGTARQIGLLLAAQGLTPERARDALAPLSPGRAVFYCGRMFAEDATIEARLRGDIAAFLAESPVAAAFGSLACGADILIAEEMLAAGIPLHVFLAAPEEVFLGTSVRHGGPGWEARFHTCLAGAAEVRIVNDAFHGPDPLAFALTSRMGMGLALDFAARNGCDAHQLAILGGVDTTDGAAGTNADVDRWRATGHAATVIRAEGLTRPAAPSGDSETPAVTRREVSLLFADFAGFSSLPDAALPDVVDRAMGALSKVLGQEEAHVLFRNTWGDACFAVFATTAPARRVALALLERLRTSDLRQRMRGLRISLHHGLAMELADPILGMPNYFGREVSRAARIEPVTPPDCVYASEAFVLSDMAEGALPDRFDYVGRIPLPKKFGEERLYLLRSPSRQS